MHNIQIRQEIIDRVLARRGRLNFFETMTPSKTALVVIGESPLNRADITASLEQAVMAAA